MWYPSETVTIVLAKGWLCDMKSRMPFCSAHGLAAPLQQQQSFGSDALRDKGALA